ncbi:MAG: hypothetical protein OXM87_11855 [Truepera sp.]|nr:hypothetical protein [Truepera sp.]
MNRTKEKRIVKRMFIGAALFVALLYIAGWVAVEQGWLPITPSNSTDSGLRNE